VRIEGQFYNMTVISVYAATGDEKKRNAEDVERFYNKLSDVCYNTPTNDALILPGDFNTKLGENTEIKE
jgi:exonuclease III